jgi:alkyl hydroperoxide reductase subunit AhpF
MALLNEQIRKDVQQMLADVKTPVVFKVFTQPIECQYCKETRELVEEVASLSDKLSVEIYDLVKIKLSRVSVSTRFQPLQSLARGLWDRMFRIPSGYGSAA